MPSRIIVLFNLKPGVTPADYEAWARTRDIPNVRELRSIDAFDVYRTTGLLTGGDAPYAYVEVIDVNDMAAFGTDAAADPMPAIAAEFGRMVDAIFILTERL
jgi:hypothetical protein